jgi:hypothetical protein
MCVSFQLETETTFVKSVKVKGESGQSLREVYAHVVVGGRDVVLNLVNNNNTFNGTANTLRGEHNVNGVT